MLQRALLVLHWRRQFRVSPEPVLVSYLPQVNEPPHFLADFSILRCDTLTQAAKESLRHIGVKHRNPDIEHEVLAGLPHTPA